MKPNEFFAWLSGYLTLSIDKTLSIKQLSIIYNHANLVRAISKTPDENFETLMSKLDDLKSLGTVHLIQVRHLLLKLSDKNSMFNM